MTTRTANNLVMDAGRLLGLFAPGETPSAADAIAILVALQDLLAEWSDGGLMVPVTTTEALTTVAAQASYTIGENGSPSLDTVRPEQIIGAYYRSGDYDYPIKIISEREYRAITYKAQGGDPELLYPVYSAPNMTVYLYPVPDSIMSVYITSIKPFSEPAGLTENLMTTTLIPRNFYSALKYNLAIEIAPMFHQEPSQTLMLRAVQTKNKVIAMNLARTMQPAQLEVGLIRGGRGRNILSM